MNENSRGLRKHHKVRKFCLKASLVEESIQKDKKTVRNALKTSVIFPRLCCHAPLGCAKQCRKALFLYTCEARALSREKTTFCNF